MNNNGKQRNNIVKCIKSSLNYSIDPGWNDLKNIENIVLVVFRGTPKTRKTTKNENSENKTTENEKEAQNGDDPDEVHDYCRKILTIEWRESNWIPILWF